LRVFPPFSSHGFTLIELIGVLAIIAILLGLIAPNVIGQIKSAKRHAEEKNLGAIAQGIDLYIRQNRDFPATLSALSPDYIQLPAANITTNDEGYTRYYVTHPGLSSGSLAAGVPESELPDARFLLISHLSQNVNPTITNDTEFETWWNTDETAREDLKVYRGQISRLFHLVSISADGAGGSYQIEGTATNSGGGTLALYTKYHLTGASIQYDEANTFATAEAAVTLKEDTSFWYDADCVSGKRWSPDYPECLP